MSKLTAGKLIEILQTVPSDTILVARDEDNSLIVATELSPLTLHCKNDLPSYCIGPWCSKCKAGEPLITVYELI